MCFTIEYCPPGIHGIILADLADPADLAKVVSSTALRNPPSTHAGGQNDVSLEQTPSN